MALFTARSTEETSLFVLSKICKIEIDCKAPIVIYDRFPKHSQGVLPNVGG